MCRCKEDAGLCPIRTSAAAPVHPAAAHRDKMYLIQTPNLLFYLTALLLLHKHVLLIFTVGQLHGEIQDVKVHLKTLNHELETYTGGSGLTRVPAVGLIFIIRNIDSTCVGPLLFRVEFELQNKPDA